MKIFELDLGKSCIVKPIYMSQNLTTNYKFSTVSTGGIFGFVCAPSYVVQQSDIYNMLFPCVCARVVVYSNFLSLSVGKCEVLGFV
jgi:hypothetical protein